MHQTTSEWTDDQEPFGPLASERSFVELFRAYGPSVLTFVQGILRDRAQAEEVVQETFLQVWQRRDRYRPERGSIKSWLFTIARSRSIDRIRTSKATREREQRFVERDCTVAECVSSVTERRVDASRQSGVLWRAVGAIPEAQRECVLLSLVEGLSHSQIAERTGAPLGTVKSRILHGLRKLRAARGTCERVADAA